MAVNFADGQVVFDNDLEALLRAIEGTGILSGWTTDPHSPAGMSVDVAAGVGYVGSSKKETAETTNVAIAAADSTKARRDIIIWDKSESELAAVTGTAAAILPYGETDFKKMSSPSPPDIPADDDILIAQVYIAAGTSSIVAANIWEKRYILPFTKQPGAVSGLATLDASGDVPVAQIPNLAASKITSEQFGLARMPRGTDSYVLTGTGASNPAYEAIPPVTVVQIDVTSKATATTGSWVDVDCSGQIPAGAHAALGFLHNTYDGNYEGGVRENGASDEGTYIGLGPSGTTFFVVQLDANRVFEQKINNALVDCYIVGYMK